MRGLGSLLLRVLYLLSKVLKEFVKVLVKVFVKVLVKVFVKMFENTKIHYPNLKCSRNIKPNSF